MLFTCFSFTFHKLHSLLALTFEQMFPLVGSQTSTISNLLSTAAYEAMPLMFHHSYNMCFFYRHSFLCLYGAVGLGLILAGELKEKRVIYILTGKLAYIQICNYRHDMGLIFGFVFWVQFIIALKILSTVYLLMSCR